MRRSSPELDSGMEEEEEVLERAFWQRIKATTSSWMYAAIFFRRRVVLNNGAILKHNHLGNNLSRKAWKTMP